MTKFYMLPMHISLLDAIFGRTTKAVIEHLFASPERAWHVRELAKAAGVSPTMLSREIDRLAMAGVVIEEKQGNRRQVKANPECPIFDELCGIAAKTVGVADVVALALEKVEGIECAWITGSFAEGKERPGSDLRVFVIGSAKYRVLSTALESTSAAIGRRIDVLVYTSKNLLEQIEESEFGVIRTLRAKKIFVSNEPKLKEIMSYFLTRFSMGLISKDQAIEFLGLRDYSELLLALGEADLPLPTLLESEISS